MTLDELIELHEIHYLRLYKNPSSTDELEICEQTLSYLRELKQTMRNFSGRQMENAALAIQMIADLKRASVEDKHIVLDSICGDNYWDAIIDWAVRVMTTNKYITPSMEINFMKRMYEQEEEDEANE